MQAALLTPPLAQLPLWFSSTWQVGVGAVLLVLGVVLLPLALGMFMPKVTAMAVTTAKAALAHPLFWVEILAGAFVMVLFFPFTPYYTFGEDVKVLKDSGLTLIMVLAIIQALWTASTSIAEEIEGRTALTLLSKPIRRWQFILGKFLGILGPVALMFIVLGAVFLATVSYKVYYEALETSSPAPTVEQYQHEMLQVVPGLELAFFETVVLTAISVAISTRLPMVANLLICSAIYVMGNLLPTMAQSSVGQFPLVRFMATLFATVLPVLDYFNMQPAVSAGADVPLEYVALSFLYCVIYSAAALVVALLLFEDRDLA